MVSEAEKFSEEDKKKREAVDTKNQADSTVYQTEKQIKELADKVRLRSYFTSCFRLLTQDRSCNTLVSSRTCLSWSWSCNCLGMEIGFCCFLCTGVCLLGMVFRT